MQEVEEFDLEDLPFRSHLEGGDSSTAHEDILMPGWEVAMPIPTSANRFSALSGDSEECDWQDVPEEEWPEPQPAPRSHKPHKTNKPDRLSGLCSSSKPALKPRKKSHISLPHGLPPEAQE